ncbi:hypothetical protein, unknown function [Leishmania tarentolae]|uniref:Uncharacterized protein n=1 Tax=Leishmania tarentolae TaxID=5689 RepID=A0A640KLM8_LEITA|nr:hypothetical protein, unknown function [Leishmania tarentolae]
MAQRGKTFAVCALIDLPDEHSRFFCYLRGAQLFFFDVVRKLNRINLRDKRVLFVTDHMISVASMQGHISRCAKVEDISELIFDPQARAIGVRMRSHPFTVEPKDFRRWNCFHEMPVDLLVHATSEAQYEALINVLCFVYHSRTKGALLCRPLKKHETWKASLVLAPDGVRVKKAIQYYDIADIRSEGRTDTVAFSSTRSKGASGNLWPSRAQTLISSLIASGSAPHSRSEAGVSNVAPLQRHKTSFSANSSFTSSDAADHRKALELSSRSFSSSPAHPLTGLPRDTLAVPTSATRRSVNPLLKADRTDFNTSSGRQQRRNEGTAVPKPSKGRRGGDSELPCSFHLLQPGAANCRVGEEHKDN